MAGKRSKAKEAARGKTRCPGCRKFYVDVKSHKCPKDNPKPKKPRKTRKKQQPVISNKTYNLLWDAYREKQNVVYCAKKAGVNEKTARKYIDGPGAPHAMMHPIGARWARVQEAAVEEEDLTLAAFRRQTLHDLVLPGMKMLESERALAGQEIMRRLEEFKKNGTIKGKMPLSVFVKTLDKLARLGERMLGGADLKVDQHVGGLEQEFEDWSEEELIEYSTTGRKPKDV